MTSFFVPGIPAPQGSKRHLGNGVMVESSKRVKPWRTDIREEAAKQFDGPHLGPLHVALEFRMPRPRSHYRTGKHAGELRDAAPRHHAKRPDVDKLARAAMDAMTDVVWRDDAQVAGLLATKTYDEQPGLWVTVTQLGEVVSADA